MAILIHSTVEGDSSEGWFRSAVRVQKVEQLNAALSLLLWLLHIQQVTHFHPPTPPPNSAASHQLVFSGGGEGNILSSLSWLGCLCREKAISEKCKTKTTTVQQLQGRPTGIRTWGTRIV